MCGDLDLNLTWMQKSVTEELCINKLQETFFTLEGDIIFLFVSILDFLSGANISIDLLNFVGIFSTYLDHQNTSFTTDKLESYRIGCIVI